jgi:hypothetical protein
MTRTKLFGLALACAALYANAETVPARQVKGHTISVHGATDQPYALVRPGERGTQGSGNSADWKAIDAAKRAIPGDFLWFRHDGKAYVVRDAALLAKVIDAWAPVQRLGDDMDVYGRQMEQHGKAMEALGRKMEQVGRDADVAGRSELRQGERNIEHLARDQERLGRQMDKLGREMERADAARREALRREMDGLGRQMAALGRQIEEQAETMSGAHERTHQGQAPMEDIGRQMKEAGKPMNALGKKMDVLGKQIDAEARVAEKTMRALIRDALAQGLATPAPAA